ncbi:MAG TPA: SlyX family protein [Azospirillaceae bacterium]|nr:SlyX family protein [Azospirillaceae bacterium]
MDDIVDRRLTELESRLAHHERMAEELSAVMFEQGRTIGLLTAQVRRLVERLAAAEAGMERSPQDDKPPPHY